MSFEELAKQDSAKTAAIYFNTLSHEQREAFYALDPKEQARLLRVPDRRRNKFVRDYAGASTVLAHIDFMVKKKKGNKYAGRAKKSAQMEGYVDHYEERKHHQKKREKAEKKNKDADHYQFLARQIELEECKGII